MKKILPIIPLFVIVFSCHKPGDEFRNYHTFTYNVIHKNSNYLNDYKRWSERNWGADWKLVGAKISTTRMTSTTVGKPGSTVVPDTGCVIEWNKFDGKEGIIRRENYSDDPLRGPDVEVLHYKNDSIYSEGLGVFIFKGKYLFLERLSYQKKKIPCKPCGDFSYQDYEDFIGRDASYSSSLNSAFEEIRFPDSTGSILCSYQAPQFLNWGMSEKGNWGTAYVQSDTTITSTGSCSFVEVRKN
ncbi:MAG TPA: hypothetical protein VL651_00540 [Bacteroidia bacterium]|nr:hypothetical protein [Bacteroidia bacterium]